MARKQANTVKQAPERRAEWTREEVQAFSHETLVSEFARRLALNHYDPHGQDDGYFSEADLLEAELFRRLRATTTDN